MVDPEALRSKLLARLQVVGVFATYLSAMEQTGYWPFGGWRRIARLIAKERAKIARMKSVRLLWQYPQLDAWIQAREESIPHVGSVQ